MMISRDFYLNKIIHSMWDGEIKVITGIRRCGKSVLLFDLFYNYLLKTGVSKDNIIKIELDQASFAKYRNPLTLCEYIESLVKPNQNQKFYLFIDEVQFTSKILDKGNGNIEITIYDMLNELRSYKNLDVYVTGSNSKGLSHDIQTEFRGRATQIHVYPLSFEEYYSYKQQDINKALNEYFLYGGMPKLLSINDETDKKKYLSSLYDVIYIKDLVERNKLEREDILNNILDFLASNISSLTNPTNVANALMSIKKEKINSSMISKYIQYMIDSFLIYVVKRYDIKGKTYFKYPNKYYYTDIGLRNIRLNYRQYDQGHIMENALFNDLIRRGYSVDIGVINDRTEKQNTQKEIDFVINSEDKKTYIQSAFSIPTSTKESQELSSLLMTKDFFKKIIVRMDISHNYYDDNGILHCNIADFLLGKIDIF